MSLNLLIRTDGGSRGNPGPSGIGVVIEDAEKGIILEEHAKYIGETTNNQAEYQAVILGLTRAVTLGASSVTVVADSELLVKQMTGKYKVKNPGLAQRFLDVRNLEVRLGVPVYYRHVRREQNTHADRLANEAMDRKR